MKKNNCNVLVFYLFIISLYACSTSKRLEFDVISLSKIKTKDKNKQIRNLFIDTLDFKKLKSLKKVTTYEYEQNNKVPIECVIEMLSQLDSVNSIVFRRIDYLPDNISKLKKLEYLSIFSANIEELPESMWQLNNLYNLQIGYSMYSSVKHKIKKLPDNIVELKNLEYLTLNSTDISTFPMVLCDLKKLHRLDIRGTVMDSIPDCICNLESFETYQKEVLAKLPCSDNFIKKEAKVVPDTTKKRKYYLHNLWMKVWARYLKWKFY